MNQKHSQNIYHANVRVNLMIKNVIQIKKGITINVGVSAKVRKNIICPKKNLAILLVKMVNI